MYSSITLLLENDYVGMTFWLATAIMLASTVFFFIERSDVPTKWKTSMTVAGLVIEVHFGIIYICEKLIYREILQQSSGI